MSRFVLVLMVLLGCNEANLRDITKLFPSGSGAVLEPEPIHDVVAQAIKPETDILWVIDDSCSMADEQTKLAVNFHAFADYLINSDLDWHIGVVSTDMTNATRSGRLVEVSGIRFIDPLTINPQAVFSSMAQLGIYGSGYERGLLAGWTALALPNPEVRHANRGFLRDDASLHVIVISDENDQSAPDINRFEFTTYLRDLKADPDIPVTFSAIVGPLTGCIGAYPGTEYIAVAEATGGVVASICDEEWVPVLEQLGLLAIRLRREYFLTRVPNLESLEVWVEDGDYLTSGILSNRIPERSNVERVCADMGLSACFPYDYNPVRNSIVMTTFVPPQGAVLHAKYYQLGDVRQQHDDSGE